MLFMVWFIAIIGIQDLRLSSSFRSLHNHNRCIYKTLAHLVLIVHCIEVGRNVVRSQMISEYFMILCVPVISEAPYINSPQYDCIKMRGIGMTATTLVNKTKKSPHGGRCDLSQERTHLLFDYLFPTKNSRLKIYMQVTLDLLLITFYLIIYMCIHKCMQNISEKEAMISKKT